jgi:hypothetical protein
MNWATRDDPLALPSAREFNDGAQTRMTHSDGPYPAGRNHAEAGWSAAFDNLAALVAGETRLHREEP